MLALQNSLEIQQCFQSFLQPIIVWIAGELRPSYGDQGREVIIQRLQTNLWRNIFIRRLEEGCAWLLW